MGIFDNVSLLIIEDKEVQSIKLASNNAILYENVLELTFNQDTYTATNGICTIECSLTQNNVGLNNKRIELEGSDNSMYIGYTNNNGIVSFELDMSNGQDLNFIAKYRNITTECTVVGELQTLTNIKILCDASINQSIELTKSKFSGSNSSLIDWGDGTVTLYNSVDTTISHTYDSENIYEIKMQQMSLAASSSAFEDISNIISINIANTAFIPTTARIRTFYNCINLKDVIFNHPIGTSAFYNCISLQYMYIDTLEGNGCFENCTSLIKVVMSEKVTEMGSTIFKNCLNLIDYQMEQIIPPTVWSNTNMPNNQDTYWTIPFGVSFLYEGYDFPSNKLIERNGAYSNEIIFDSNIYNSSDGTQTIYVEIADSIGASKEVLLYGSDQSNYSSYTDAETGIATFELFGEGDIEYLALYDGKYNKCLVNGMDNKIQIMKPTCSRSVTISGGSRRQTLTFTVKDENGNVVPGVKGVFPYAYKSSSSATTAYRTTNIITNSNGTGTYTGTCSGTSGSCYPSYSCAINGDASHRPSVTGNWKYKSYTYS